MGTPLTTIRRLLKYWETEYDWRKVKARLNQLPHYTITFDFQHLQAREIHFIHERSSLANAIPPLFLHGWHGSFLEVTMILPELVTSSPAFHVVAPSLVDCGFSSGSGETDFGIDDHAELYHGLMTNLGYSEYVVQAGDVGHLIARVISLKYGPSHCKAHHINSASPAEPNADSHPGLLSEAQSMPLTDTEKGRLKRAAEFATHGLGYYSLQSTKPATIGYALRDSPVALLAWIYEKIHDWSDNFGQAWTDENVITWVCVHHFSRAGPEAPSNLYWAIENRKPETGFKVAQRYIDVPLGITRHAKDLLVLPSLWNKGLGPVVFEREHATGGHFAAWEKPDLLVADLKEMFGRGCHIFIWQRY